MTQLIYPTPPNPMPENWQPKLSLEITLPDPSAVDCSFFGELQGALDGLMKKDIAAARAYFYLVIYLAVLLPKKVGFSAVQNGQPLSPNEVAKWLEKPELEPFKAVVSLNDQAKKWFVDQIAPTVPPSPEGEDTLNYGDFSLSLPNCEELSGVHFNLWQKTTNKVNKKYPVLNLTQKSFVTAVDCLAEYQKLPGTVTMSGISISDLEEIKKNLFAKPELVKIQQIAVIGRWFRNWSERMIDPN